MSSACEVDICGVVGMHALRLASETPSALLDWNNNYGDDPNKAVCFHCSNLPKHFFADVKMDFQEIIAGTVGKREHVRDVRGPGEGGAHELRALLHRRRHGRDSRLRGEGEFTDDPLETFGGAGVVRDSATCRSLLRYICEHGFEHHVAANLCDTAPAVYEAATRYLGWEMHWHASVLISPPRRRGAEDYIVLCASASRRWI